MTPIASRVIHQLARPASRRDAVIGGPDQFDHEIQPLPDTFLSGMHFFDATALFDHAYDVMREINRKGIPHDLIFLPAPATWIELSPTSAISLRHDVMRNTCAVHYIVAPNRIAAIPFQSLDLNDANLGLPPDYWKNYYWKSDLYDQRKPPVAWLVAANLVLINSPRIIGRRQIMADAGVQKRIAKSKGALGKFPLMAYTELKLEVGPPKDMSGHQPGETRLSGDRCRHFVRAHLRLVGGQLVKVKSHWRGDASLGIKRTRYKLEPA